ncbi:MAG TPA: LamG-like jellyroll fold domain-containing protein [Pseudonocardiaceae bacterium]
MSQTNRRGFLRATGLVGASAAVLGMSGTASADPANGRSGWNPDPNSPQFTLAVMPDTQFLYFDDSLYPDVQRASFQFVVNESGQHDHNIVFLAHLGDLTEDGLATEFASVSTAFDYLDERRVAYSVLAGNHDINSSTTDQRGDTPYLDVMGPHRFAHSPSFRGATPDGYNTYHVFHAAGRDWLVLAMDWRPSPAGFAWANNVIKQHPSLPVILTTHETGAPTYDSMFDPPDYGDPNNNAVLSDFGQQMWDQLVKDNDQIFISFSGHNWPPGRTVLKNGKGNDVHVHVTDYQNRYFGGAAMMRLYHFDLTRNVIDVETLAPWVLAQSPEQRNVLAQQVAELTSPVDYFSIPFDFADRFGGFDPVPVPPSRPAKQMLVPGTVAYWRFDSGQANGVPYASSSTIKDQSGHGNDLTTLVTVPGSAANALTWSADHHPDQPGHGSLYFQGGQNPLHGAYLSTAANAPLNTATFTSGFTFEAYFKIPADFSQDNNSWQAMLSRWGESGQAGKTGDGTDPQEPIVTLSVSNGRQIQWCVYPTNLNTSATNWSHELPANKWWHVAVVNDGRHTKMYIDGCLVVDNPLNTTIGLTQLNLPWVLGGYEYGGSINQIFNGWIGDVRIVNRALSVNQFMINR